MKTKIFTVANQKGGVGKTTTALATASYLAKKGFKVLLVDIDSQGNATLASGFNVGEYQGTYEVLSGESTIDELIVQGSQFDLLVASNNLSTIDKLLSNETGREYRLKEAFESVNGRYDFIIIDTPPQLSTLTVNALTACDEVIIPVQADAFSIQGTRQLVDTITKVKGYTNKNIKIAGVLLTRYSNRAILSKDIKDKLDEFARRIDSKLFNISIRETVTVKESQIQQRMLSEYKATASQDYEAFVDELLEG